MNQDYQAIAEFLCGIGWRPIADGQHTSLRAALPKLREMLAPPVVDGGPAFPHVETRYEGEQGDYTQFVESIGGMTLRDYFAAKMAQALYADPQTFSEWQNDPGESRQFQVYVAANAYKYADAMLAERAK